MSLLAVISLLGRPVASLTLQDLSSLRDAFNLRGEITPAMRDTALKMLSNKGATLVSDIASNPSLIEDLRRFLEPATQAATDASTLIQCIGCDGFSFTDKVRQSNACPHCSRFIELG